MNTNVRRPAALVAGLVLIALASGCGKYDPPQFRLNMVAVVQAQLPVTQQQELTNILEGLYGTPDEPFALSDTGLDMNKLRMAAGPVRSDQFGRETGLYRRHCSHCHGTTGDGQGPTAFVLNPYPRDYRQGKFKFKSTTLSAKPTEYDVERILRHGVAGTAMPSFELLPDPQIKALVEYVKYLSLRGETEIRLIDALVDLSEGENLPIDRATIVDGIVVELAKSWADAGASLLQPQDPPPHVRPATELAASVDEGRKLFYSETAKCRDCHGPSALGDGENKDYDVWNKPIKDLTDEVDRGQKALAETSDMTAEQKAALKKRIADIQWVLEYDALPLRTIAPRNLRQGVYRGGRRPLDLYRRIYVGINGTPMPGQGAAAGAAAGAAPEGPGMKPAQVWSLVDYVQSLPYEAMSAPPRQQRPTGSQAKF